MYGRCARVVLLASLLGACNSGDSPKGAPTPFPPPDVGALTIDRTQADLGTTPVGHESTTTAEFVIRNDGGSTSGAVLVEITGEGFLLADACGATLAPAGTCTVTVRFKPTTVGAHSGQLTVRAMPGGLLTARSRR